VAVAALTATWKNIRVPWTTEIALELSELELVPAVRVVVAKLIDDQPFTNLAISRRPIPVA
jgi:hypothetical protein